MERARRSSIAEQTLHESRLDEIVLFVEKTDSIESQRAIAKSVKRSKGTGTVCGGFVMIVVMLVLAASIPGGLVFRLVLLAIGLFGGIRVIRLGMRQKSAAPDITFSQSAQQLCERFYGKTLLQGEKFPSDREDMILEICEVLPVPVIEKYQVSGWSTYGDPNSPKPPPQGIACSKCGKDLGTSDGETRYISVCDYCGTAVCTVCTDALLANLCPTCGCATGGWQWLAMRWNRLRRALGEIDSSEDMALSLEVEQAPRPETGAFDLFVRVQVGSGRELLFHNVAFHFGGGWLLCSPEPIVV